QLFRPIAQLPVRKIELELEAVLTSVVHLNSFLRIFQYPADFPLSSHPPTPGAHTGPPCRANYLSSVLHSYMLDMGHEKLADKSDCDPCDTQGPGAIYP